MQHFFNTHIFKSSIESCREEGIQCELEPDYVDNVPCIDLISSLVQTSLSILSSTGFFFKSILFSQIADGPVEYAGRGVQRPRHPGILCPKGQTPAQAQQQALRVQIRLIRPARVRHPALCRPSGLRRLRLSRYWNQVDVITLRWFKNILSLHRYQSRRSPRRPRFRLLQTELPIRIRHPFVRIRTQSAFRPGDGAQGHSIPYFPNFAHGLVRNVVISTRLN